MTRAVLPRLTADDPLHHFELSRREMRDALANRFFLGP